MTHAMMIVYVADQAKASAFYEALLELKPILDVPGMTEFQLADGFVFGLMPWRGIRALIGDAFDEPISEHPLVRSELYLTVADVEATYHKSLSLGAKALSPPQPRNWGDTVAYVMDSDGTVLAFAKKTMG